MKKNRKILEIHHAIRKRICTQGKLFFIKDAKFEKYSLFIFTPKRIPNKGRSNINSEMSIT